MDYENFHSLQEQVNILGHSANSSLPVAPSTVVSSPGNNYTWNTSINTLKSNTDLYPNETIPNSRTLSSLATSFMASQDLSYGFDHAILTRRSAPHELPLPNIKEETTSNSFSNLRINIPLDQSDKPNLLSTLYKQDNNQIIGLTSDSPPYLASHQPLHSNAQNNSASFGAGFTSFGHIFSNTSTLTRSSSGSLSSFVLTSHEGYNNSQALDLLSSPSSTSNYHNTQSCSPSTQNFSNLSLYRECNMSLEHVHHHMQESKSSRPSNTSKVMNSGLFNEVTRTKRRSPSSTVFEPKDQPHNAEAKKSKSTLRSPNPPLKVRKEKLGDRISALHRLVAPFGKTDTASVLAEAIGYIQFLHDQVQTLSMPYMKSSQSKPSRKMKQVRGFGKDEESEVLRMDLRSRGLCLVPLSCASYFNGFD